MEAKTEPDNTQEKITHPGNSPRPLFLTIICLFAYVYFGIFSLFCLLALFKSGWIADVKDQYLPPGTSSKGMTIFIYSTATLLHLAAFWGVIKIWQQKRRGYLIFSVCALVLAAYQFFSDQLSLLTTLVYIGLIILFGAFYRRLN